MTQFPFTTFEWTRLSGVARAVVNATLAGDDVLHSASIRELYTTLSELRDKHGSHPILLETEADYTDDPTERIVLYERAARTAEEHRLQTHTIRIALARVLLNDVGQPGRAARELDACFHETLAQGDESERKEWRELRTECELALRTT